MSVAQAKAPPKSNKWKCGVAAWAGLTPEQRSAKARHIVSARKRENVIAKWLQLPRAEQKALLDSWGLTGRGEPKNKTDAAVVRKGVS